MSGNYFGWVELIFTFGLAVAFYIWQMTTLKRDVKAREEREARDAVREAEARANSTPPASTPGHPDRQHELDET